MTHFRYTNTNKQPCILAGLFYAPPVTLIFELMALPYFFLDQIDADNLTLPEETSKHIIQVLRMQKGESIMLTDGKGVKVTATITYDNRKKCVVHVSQRETESAPVQNVSIGISLLKNATRFEWFLEKVTEIGVRKIIPLLCDRTEKEKFRHDRMNAILISAMLQSQQVWLPGLSEPTPFQKIVAEGKEGQKFIAHCLPNEKVQLSSVTVHSSSLILIGPEGDFTEGEVKAALEQDFKPVALGNTRLRTETAGVVAATLLCNRG